MSTARDGKGQWFILQHKNMPAPDADMPTKYAGWCGGLVDRGRGNTSTRRLVRHVFIRRSSSAHLNHPYMPVGRNRITGGSGGQTVQRTCPAPNKCHRCARRTHRDEIPHSQLLFLARQRVSKELVGVYLRRHKLQYPPAKLLHPPLKARPDVHISWGHGLQIPEVSEDHDSVVRKGGRALPNPGERYRAPGEWAITLLLR